MTERKIEVDMSGKAIDARLRDVAQLRKLGLSIANAKPIVASNSTLVVPTDTCTPYGVRAGELSDQKKDS